MNITILASHEGTNLQAILDASESGELDARVVLVISNNSRAGAMTRARDAGIETLHLSGVTHPDAADLDAHMCEAAEAHGTDLIVTAGYMKKLGPRLLARYEGRILNIHPSLLPRHGGKGMFGLRVHEAVLAAGDSETGATVHQVNAHYDEGDIVAQARIPVEEDDTPESLATRLRPLEHELLIRTLMQFVDEARLSH